MPSAIGYARVSTHHQSTDNQVATLKEAGCSQVFYEVISSRVAVGERHQLQAALTVLEAGDELIITKLDRLGRNQREIINTLHELQEKGVHIRTLDGLIATKALGKLAPILIGLLTGLSEVERELIRERTKESVEHRRRTGGNVGGRKPISEAKVAYILRLRGEGSSIRKIAELTGISTATIHKTIHAHPQ
jgi:DNA invertase Pin-like site-specific DNA recombinase